MNVYFKYGYLEPIPKFDKIIALFPLLITVTCIQRMDSVKKNNKHPTILKVPDELWDKIKNIFPKEKPLRTVGRPIVPYRKVIDGILYVLRTGCQWKMLPKEYGSGSTCHRRFQK